MKLFSTSLLTYYSYRMYTNVMHIAKDSAKKPPSQQINVRWEQFEIETLNEIAEKERIPLSELVRFLTRWALRHYIQVGSLEALNLTSFTDTIQSITKVLQKAARRIKKLDDRKASPALVPQAEESSRMIAARARLELRSAVQRKREEQVDKHGTKARNGHV